MREAFEKGSSDRHDLRVHGHSLAGEMAALFSDLISMNPHSSEHEALFMVLLKRIHGHVLLSAHPAW
jgi:hypothetical protein